LCLRLLHTLGLRLSLLNLRLGSLWLRLRPLNLWLRALHLRLRSLNLWLRALHLRLCPLKRWLCPLNRWLCSLNLRPRSCGRLRHYSRLSLRPVFGLLATHLHRRLRPDLLLLLRVSNRRRLGALLALDLNLLLRRSPSLLLVADHLVTRSRPLRLHLLPDTFGLRLLSADALGALLLNLLPAKFLHLLARVSITARRLSGEVHHLSLSGLLCSHVRLARHRSALSRSRLAFVSELNLLVLTPVRHRFNSQGPGQVSFETWS